MYLTTLCKGRWARDEDTSAQWLALAGVTAEFVSLPDYSANVTVEDAITHVFGQDPGYVDDAATGKPALLS